MLELCSLLLALLVPVCGADDAPGTTTTLGPLAPLTHAHDAPGPHPDALGPVPWWWPERPAPVLDPYDEMRLLQRAAERAERPLSDDAGGNDEPRPYNGTSDSSEPVERAADLEPPEPPADTPSRSVWDDLADCESGNWIDGGASFETGSARWHWAKPGTEVPPWGTTIHHGGLQFHPDTWTWLRSDHHPTHAYDATREEQIEVAERVLDAQGWGAWPVCSRKVGLR